MVEITTTGTHHRLAVDDPAMVGLGEAADGAAMADRLAASVTHPVATCAVEPISYRPGAHCVLRYDLQAGPADGDRTVLFGKVYASGMATVAERLTELHRCGRLDGSFEVAGPLDTAPELGLVVQPEAGGQSLGRRVFDPAAPHSRRLDAEAAGRALAGLHRCAGPAGPARALADELEDLRAQVGLVAGADPALARRVDAVLDHLQRVAPAPVTPGAQPWLVPGRPRRPRTGRASSSSISTGTGGASPAEMPATSSPTSAGGRCAIRAGRPR